jgi:hypothetical protein
MQGIKHRYRLKIDLGKERVPWKTQIVMSKLPATQLPISMKRDGVKTVCTVESVLSDGDMKLKNRHWFVPSTYAQKGALTVQVQLWSSVSPG